MNELQALIEVLKGREVTVNIDTSGEEYTSISVDFTEHDKAYLDEIEKLVGEYKTIYDEIRQSGYDYWREDEFSRYIVKETNRKTITNFAMRMKYDIGEDNEFYWIPNNN